MAFLSEETVSLSLDVQIGGWRGVCVHSRSNRWRIEVLCAARQRGFTCFVLFLEKNRSEGLKHLYIYTAVLFFMLIKAASI